MQYFSAANDEHKARKAALRAAERAAKSRAMLADRVTRSWEAQILSCVVLDAWRVVSTAAGTIACETLSLEEARCVAICRSQACHCTIEHCAEVPRDKWAPYETWQFGFPDNVDPETGKAEV